MGWRTDYPSNKSRGNQRKQADQDEEIEEPPAYESGKDYSLRLLQNEVARNPAFGSWDFPKSFPPNDASNAEIRLFLLRLMGTKGHNVEPVHARDCIQSANKWTGSTGALKYCGSTYFCLGFTNYIGLVEKYIENAILSGMRRHARSRWTGGLSEIFQK